ncbi:MAG TPA: hypothetical protein VLG50_07940 [Candidatus Saccharimonadales bacterium]|nr:hypothetical protein [Candidatus Saccharimonadales bacterium]
MYYQYNHNIHRDSTIHINDIFNMYQKDKQNMIQLLKTDIDKLIHLINTTPCRDYCYKDNKCFHCLNMFYLNDNIVINEPFIVLKQWYMMIDEVLNKIYLKKINGQLVGNQLTMKTLITWTIEDLFNQHLLPHALKLELQYCCHHHGYMLYRVPVMNGELCHFNDFIHQFNDQLPELAYGLLCQIIVIFNELKSLYYHHQDINLDIFLFDQKKCSYKYRKNLIKSPYTMILCNMDDVIVTINDTILLFNNNNNHHDYNNKHVEQKDNLFKLDMDDIEQLKCPYMTSIDFYMIIVLLFKKQFFEKNDKSLMLIKTIFPDFDQFEINLKTSNDPFRVINNIWLYKDPMSIALTKMS